MDLETREPCSLVCPMSKTVSIEVEKKDVGDTSFCATEKRVSQWEELMRKFSKQHEEQCKAVSLDIPRVFRTTKCFPTGSRYTGTWDILGMSGYGVYVFPNGVIYEGEFEDGMFHGKGKLLYQGGYKIIGRFHKGVMTERKLIFDDGLVYDEVNWQYCKLPDRRFSIEYKKGLQPAGRSNLTAKLPTRTIPPGFYDTGDGFYNPVTRSVFKADDLSAIIRSPSVDEQKWIVKNCRSSEDNIVGPRQDLYEQWLKPQVTLPLVPPPAVNIKSQYISTPCSFDEQDNIPLKSFHIRLDPDTTTKWREKEQFGQKISNELVDTLDSKTSPRKDRDEKMSNIKLYRNFNDEGPVSTTDYDYGYKNTKMMTFHDDNDVSLTSLELQMLKSSTIGITSSILTFKDAERGIIKRSQRTKRYHKYTKQDSEHE